MARRRARARIARGVCRISQGLRQGRDGRCPHDGAERSRPHLLQRRHDGLQLRARPPAGEEGRRAARALREVRQPPVGRRAERADRRVPAGVREGERPAAARCVGGAPHLAGKHGRHARAPRRIEQHRLRGRRPPPLHAVAAGAGGEPLHRAARLRADGNADQPRRLQESRLRALPEVSRGARGRAASRTSGRATRSTSRRSGGITSSRSRR